MNIFSSRRQMLDQMGNLFPRKWCSSQEVFVHNASIHRKERNFLPFEREMHSNFNSQITILVKCNA